jgi:CheY-like chemotaxis protein
MSKRILLVEDDPDGQAVIARIAHYIHLEIEVAGDAMRAEHILFDSDTPFDAALIDLGLPGKTGWELLSTIQAHPTRGTLPCFAITAFHTAAIRDEALRVGFAAYFPKPIDPASFAVALANLV